MQLSGQNPLDVNNVAVKFKRLQTDSQSQPLHITQRATLDPFSVDVLFV